MFFSRVPTFICNYLNVSLIWDISCPLFCLLHSCQIIIHNFYRIFTTNHLHIQIDWSFHSFLRHIFISLLRSGMENNFFRVLEGTILHENVFKKNFRNCIKISKMLTQKISFPRQCCIYLFAKAQPMGLTIALHCEKNKSG